MDLYFTRHGRTQWNLERRFQGREKDSPLLKESYHEIERLGKHLKEIPFECIYSSTSLRAKETALGIQAQLQKNVPIHYSDDLRELHYGTLEGENIDDMYRIHQEQLRNMRYQIDQYDPRAFGGETLEAMLERNLKVIYEAMAIHQGPLLFVGHGASLTAVIQTLVGTPPEKLRSFGGLSNNSLTIVQTKETIPFEMKIWNDQEFLK